MGNNISNIAVIPKPLSVNALENMLTFIEEADSQKGIKEQN
jgi:hypothetical protein